jgi:hypothetical protein
MASRSDEVWQWSGEFLEVLERWIEKPPLAAAARRDRTKHKLRLALWQREVEKARARDVPGARYALTGASGGFALAVRPLRAIAPTAAEQARLGCERYHEFQRLLSD